MSNVTPQNNQSSGDSALPIPSLVFALIFPIAGAIIGHVALSQMNAGRILDTNRGLAKAGVIVGWVLTGLFILGSVFWGAVMVWLINEGYDLYP
jgi:hypothetical protein